MSKLIITEKPSVAKDIAAVLGKKNTEDGYIELKNGDIITWAVGHLIELADPGAYNKDWEQWKLEDLPIIPESIKLEIKKDTKKQYKIIEKLIKETSIIVIATDAGREGELIGRWLLKKANFKGNIERLWLNSMTDDEIKQAFQNLKPGKDYENLFYAAEQRAIADWLVGLNATRAYTKKANTLLSIGRVQTPTLAMIVEREKEILNFKSILFYEVLVTFKKEETNDSFVAKYYNPAADNITRIADHLTTQNIIEEIANLPGIITEHNKETKKHLPPQFFDLTNLQKHMNTKEGWTAGQTLKIAQQLYEKKHITYPRTDSRYITEELSKSLPALINKLPNSIKKPQNIRDLSTDKRYTNNTKITDHHAILPTGKEIKDITDQEQLLLDVIHRFTIAAFYDNAIDEETIIIVNVGHHNFIAKGKVIIDNSWREIIKDNNNEVAKLPAVNQGDILKQEKAEFKEGKTKPPKRYTEATILAAMETAGKELEDEEQREALKASKGLGTPATRAAILEILKKREYIRVANKSLEPTEKAMQLLAILRDHPLASPETTANWELKLKEIEQGNLKAEIFNKEIIDFTKDIISKARDQEVVNMQESIQKSESLGTCIICKKPIVDRKGFYGCSGYPGCNFSLPKKILDKTLPASAIKKILDSGKSGIIKGFTGKKGKFDASLEWSNKDNKLNFVFENKKTK
jgi:DNA topoisomerase-3